MWFISYTVQTVIEVNGLFDKREVNYAVQPQPLQTGQLI